MHLGCERRLRRDACSGKAGPAVACTASNLLAVDQGPVLGLAGVQERSDLPLMLGPALVGGLLVQAQALLQSSKGRAQAQSQIWVLELEPELTGAEVHEGVQVLHRGSNRSSNFGQPLQHLLDAPAKATNLGPRQPAVTILFHSVAG